VLDGIIQLIIGFSDNERKFGFISFPCQQVSLICVLHRTKSTQTNERKTKNDFAKIFGLSICKLAFMCMSIVCFSWGLKIEHFVFFLFNAFGRLPFACCCCCCSGHSTCKSSACISHVFVECIC